MTDALVAVDEGMILDQGEAQGCGFRNETGIQIVAAERLLGLAEGGLQQAEIPKAVGTTGLGDDHVMEP